MTRPETPEIHEFEERPINADLPLATEVAIRRAEAFDMAEEPIVEAAPRRQAGRIARSTAFFSAATAASRVAGLAREVVAAGYFGVKGPMSAFTIAFQVPNLIRALFADAALQPAFVPVFTELLGEKRYKEAFRLASTLLLLATMVLGSLTALFILLAPVIMPVFIPNFERQAVIDLTITLSQVLFPILILLGISGIVVGILNSYDRFGAFAISPLFWNLTIIAVLVAIEPLFSGEDRIYAYAIGILVGTLVQLLIPTWDLRHTPFRFSFSLDWRHPGVRRVLLLMLPVTISLGLINFNALINTFLAGGISDEAVAGVDKAFRLYMLPQGIFSVAISTVLFPQLARLAARKDHEGMQETIGTGMRLILLMLLPAMAAMIVLPDAMTRLVYEGGKFSAEDTQLVSTALLFFSFSLIFSGINLLLSRSFFSLQLPWAVTWLSLGNLVINIVASVLFLQFGWGIGGLVLGTAVADGAMVIGQVILLRRALGGQLQLGTIRDGLAGMAMATLWFAIAAFGVYHGLDWLLGRSLISQIISVGGGLAAGAGAYGYLVLSLEVPEAHQLWARVAPRLGR